jgi:hypothetical protein
VCLGWKVVVGLAAVALVVGIVMPILGVIAIPLVALTLRMASKRYILRRRHAPWCAARVVTTDPPIGEGCAGRSLLALQARLMSIRAEEEYLAGAITRLQAKQLSAAPDRWPRPSVPERAATEAVPAQRGQILIPARLHGMVESLVEVEPVGELTLKGLHRPVVAFNITGIREDESLPLDPATGQAARDA